MGLDMYAYTTGSKLELMTDFEMPDDAVELHYWRKHPDLHGWMEALYRRKCGSADSFNCVTLALSAADIDAIEHAVRSSALPDTQGFFFGDSDGTERDDDLAFISDAREAIQAGLAVFYSSWW